MNFTAEQEAIIQSKHSRINVNAGAGSGKSSALCCVAINQAKQLIKDPPFWVNDNCKVLVVSLTNRATDEASAKAAVLVQDENLIRLIGPLPTNVLSKIEFSTIHSFSFRQLLRHQQSFKHNRKKVLDNDDIQDILNEILSDVKPAWADDEFVLAMLQNLLHANGDLKDALKQKYPAFVKHFRLIQKVLTKLSKIKQSENLISFDDMVIGFNELLEQPSIREKIIKQYPVIIVDEFQDTGSRQWQVIKKLIGPKSHLLCAGDDGQTIFTWSEASFFRFRHFNKRFPKGLPYPLTSNLRSTQQIMALSNAIINQCHYATHKEMTSLKDGPKPKIILHNNQYKLYEYIVNQIKHHIDKGDSGKDIGVIYRFYQDAYHLKNHLTQNGIPFKVMGDKAKRNRPIVKFIFALIKIIEAKSSDEDWMTALLKVEWVGNHRIDAIIDWLKRKDPDDTQYPRDLKFTKPLQQLLEFVSVIRNSGASNQDKLEKIIKFSGQLPKINNPQIQHIYPTLLNLMKESKSLSKIIDKYNDLSYPFYYPGVFEPPYPYPDHYVTLSTVHRVKGGEFNTVFYLGTDETLYQKYGLFKGRKNMENELQLMNVAVTRARRDLYMLFPISTDTWRSANEVYNTWVFLKRMDNGLFDLVV